MASLSGVDPEMSKTENIKKEEERLRASIRRENQQRRTRERAHARNHMSASYLEGDEEVSISAIKNKYKVRQRGSVSMRVSQHGSFVSKGQSAPSVIYQLLQKFVPWALKGKTFALIGEVDMCLIGCCRSLRMLGGKITHLIQQMRSMRQTVRMI